MNEAYMYICKQLYCVALLEGSKLDEATKTNLENIKKVKNTDKKLDFGMLEMSLKKFSVSDNETSNIFLQY